jgi:hypothetical protein
MAMIDFSIKHGRTVEEAAAKLRTVVDEAKGKLGAMIREVTWGPDGRAVKLTGTGFHVDLRVDTERVYVSGDVGILGGLFGGKVVEGLKRIVGERFKQLPGKTGT